MKLRIALPMPLRRPFSCVPPESRGDAVDVASHVLVGRLRPAHHEVELEAGLVVFAREAERLLMDGVGLPFDQNLAEVVADSLVVLECFARRAALRGLVLERDFQSLVQVTRDLESLADDGRLELRLREDRRIGTEEHRGAGAACGAELLHAADRRALFVALFPRVAIATHGRDELARKRVHDRRADAVQAARRLVVLAFELSAGVERREDHLERAGLRLRMLVDRNPAAVVLDRHRRPVLVERDGNIRGVAVHRLVDGVVEDLPDQMVKARRADPADVHAWPAADRLEALEDRDVFGGIAGHATRIVTGSDGPKGRGVLSAARRLRTRPFQLRHGQASARSSGHGRIHEPAGRGESAGFGQSGVRVVAGRRRGRRCRRDVRQSARAGEHVDVAFIGGPPPIHLRGPARPRAQASDASGSTRRAGPGYVLWWVPVGTSA